MKKLVQSPLNYTGGKFKLLNQIIPLFPKEIETFVDLFGGGFNVGANIEADRIIYNEFDSRVYSIVKGIYDSPENIISEIDRIIENFGLSKANKDGYLALREEWNKSDNKDWLRLYCLISHSFNYQIRFNQKGEYNMPFGKDRSSFNPKLRQKFEDFRSLIKSKNIKFSNNSFEVLTQHEKIDKNCFFYVDPPYLITTASYNENGGWNEDLERLLLSELDRLNSKGVKFALSNVIEHKGKENALLKQWSQKYNIHYLNYNYNNCSYQTKEIGKTIEVLITNY